MKKRILVIALFFLFPLFVQASITDNTSCMQIDSETLECEFKFKSTENTKNYNTIGIQFTLENMTLEKIRLKEGWYVKENTGSFLSIETSKDMLGTNFSVGFVTFKKIKWAEDCHVKASFDFGKINRSCSIFEGIYYDRNGNITSAINYEKECLKPVCKVYPDGTYSDSKGNIVSKLEYQKECQKHTCQILEDGTKYGIYGTVVDEITYEKECEKPICKVYPDGTYSDSKGNIVNKIIYEQECSKKVCTIIDNIKYGLNGMMVDDLTYQKECQKNICVILSDGTIYGTNGNIIDEITYEQECIGKKYCQFENGIYYGINGEIVEEIKYQKECQKHYCEILKDGTKYGIHGNIVTDVDYNKECVKNNTKENINNPQTGSSLNIFILVIGIIVGIICCFIYKKGNKIHRL